MRVSIWKSRWRKIREQVCTHCSERPPGGLPCAPTGKRCGIELDLGPLVGAVHGTEAATIDVEPSRR